MTSKSLKTKLIDVTMDDVVQLRTPGGTVPIQEGPPLVTQAHQNEVDLLRAFNRMADAIRVGLDAGTMPDRDMQAFRAARQVFEETLEDFRRALGVNLSLMARLAEKNDALERQLECYQPDESDRRPFFSNVRHAMAVLRGR